MEQKLKELRSCMSNTKLVPSPLAAYIIPTADVHQSEYIAECDKRRAFISQFTGSAGTALVTVDQALLWTDGRYHLQASKQLDDRYWTLMKLGNPGVPSLEKWLAKNLPSGSKVGFDPNITSELAVKQYTEALDCAGIDLVPVSNNLTDVVWGGEKPPRPCNQLMVLPIKYSGRSWQNKVGDTRGKMKDNGVSVVMVTELDEIAWLLNMRGSDIEYNPVFFAYAIVTMEEVRLYIDDNHLSSEVRDHLSVGKEGEVKLFPYEAAPSHLSQLVSSVEEKVWLSAKASHSLCSLIPQTKRKNLLSPLQLLKAVKNDTEIQGMKNAHIRDAAALCEYLWWLGNEIDKGELNEVTAADKLEELRSEQPDYVSLSFPTISSSGPNGAVIHYRPEPATARPLTRQELYLCDSGGQYMDGTTDVTRTVSYGTPSQKEKECFTLVLKGHIALCTAVFPNKTMGSRIDALARLPLWKAGLDYKHGTGHGVGAFLFVHEGPQGIGTSAGVMPRYAEPLEAGMFVSDEPGYYEDGKFGIRIENVVVVVPTETKYGSGYLTMEPVTLVPIQLKMLEPSLLTADEISWINDYHSKCLEKVGCYLSDNGKTEVLKWLEKETQPIG